MPYGMVYRRSPASAVGGGDEAGAFDAPKSEGMSLSKRGAPWFTW
jgi:hypothetical protein